MLNRLSFELVERQRHVQLHDLPCGSPSLIIDNRLDQKRKELTAQKEDLLKHSKLKLATVESVKTQIESLMKVRTILCRFRSCTHVERFAGRRRHTEES
jgi:THO complex subunit 5